MLLLIEGRLGLKRVIGRALEQLCHFFLFFKAEQFTFSTTFLHQHTPSTPLDWPVNPFLHRFRHPATASIYTNPPTSTPKLHLSSAPRELAPPPTPKNTLEYTTHHAYSCWNVAQSKENGRQSCVEPAIPASPASTEKTIAAHPRRALAMDGQRR